MKNGESASVRVAMVDAWRLKLLPLVSHKYQPGSMCEGALTVDLDSFVSILSRARVVFVRYFKKWERRKKYACVHYALCIPIVPYVRSYSTVE